jgi:hypothetical protein
LANLSQYRIEVISTKPIVNGGQQMRLFNAYEACPRAGRARSAG